MKVRHEISATRSHSDFCCSARIFCCCIFVQSERARAGTGPAKNQGPHAAGASTANCRGGKTKAAREIRGRSGNGEQSQFGGTAFGNRASKRTPALPANVQSPVHVPPFTFPSHDSINRPRIPT